jgi:NADH dehydrogenase FAD-containing subunit
VANDAPPGRGPTPKRVFARPRIVVAESCAVDVHADVYAIGDTADVDYGLDYGLDYDDYHNDYD